MLNVTYLSRSDVGYDETLPRRGVAVPRQDRDGYVLHHTVGGRLLSTSIDQGLEYVRRLQTVRAADLGADVPYNFPWFVWTTSAGTRSLCVCEGRGPDRSGAHTVDTIDDDDPIEWENGALVAFGAQGDWRSARDVFSDTEIDEIVSSLGAWAYAALTVNYPNVTATYGHRQFKDTSCPSDVLFDRRELFNHYAIDGGEAMVTQAEFDALVARVDQLDTAVQNQTTENRNTRALAQRNRTRLNGIRAGAEAELDSDDPDA